MESKNYCMPDNINSKEEHDEYLKTIGVKIKTPRELFQDYKQGENWDQVDKSHKNLFTIGGQAIMIRAALLLNSFFNHKSDANKYLTAEQQEDLEKEFGEWCADNSF